MNARNRITKALALGALIISLAVAVIVWNARRVDAIGDPNIRVASFGLVSLGAGQTARLNVVNPALTAPPEGDSPGDRSRRTLSVTLAFDIYLQPPPEGDSPAPTAPGATVACVNNLRIIRRESCTAMLMPGEAASFDIGALPEGAQVRAIVIGDPNERAAGPEPHITTTLELRDAARTIFVVPGASTRIDPSDPN